MEDNFLELMEYNNVKNYIFILFVIPLFLNCSLATDYEVTGSIPAVSQFKILIRSGTESTRPHKDNWVAT
jgi:hypothetical protein